MSNLSSPIAALFEHYSPGEILKPSHRVFRYFIAQRIMPDNEPVYDEHNFRKEELDQFVKALCQRNTVLGGPVLLGEAVRHHRLLSLRDWFEVERQLDTLAIEQQLMPGKAQLDDLRHYLEKRGSPTTLPAEFNSRAAPSKPSLLSIVDQWLHQGIWRKVGVAGLAGSCVTGIVSKVCYWLEVNPPIPVAIAFLWCASLLVFNLLNQPRESQTPVVDVLLKELSQNWDQVFLMRKHMDCWLMHHMMLLAESTVSADTFGMEMWHPDDMALLCMHHPIEAKRYAVLQEYVKSQPLISNNTIAPKRHRDTNPLDDEDLIDNSGCA